MNGWCGGLCDLTELSSMTNMADQTTHKQYDEGKLYWF